ncbi:MAG: radical SAM protein [Spirochaetales bacterium]|jgi:pyruvate-formate lyase-activating enzyme|nr:radical SAM protein [Spirochaetales bacterium]
MSASEVVSEAVKDIEFYKSSGGGGTLSGGEPLYQPSFSREILALCRDAGIATALDTSLFAPWKIVESVIPLVEAVEKPDQKVFSYEQENHDRICKTTGSKSTWASSKIILMTKKYLFR